ncbi:hypothetical protein PORY_002082, partial [Pneumocystis oryctolagi]
ELFQFNLVEEFLLKAPIDFKLQLWNLLQNAYHNLSKIEDSLWCCLKALSSVTTCFKSSICKIAMTEQQRVIFILKRLFSVSFLDDDVILESLSSLLVILRILLVFCFFEDSVIDNTCFKFSNNEIFDNKLHNMQVQSWCFAYCLYKEILSRKQLDNNNFYKNITEFLCLIHEEMGIRGYCSLSDGTNDLELALKYLMKADLSLNPWRVASWHAKTKASKRNKNTI